MVRSSFLWLDIWRHFPKGYRSLNWKIAQFEVATGVFGLLLMIIVFRLPERFPKSPAAFLLLAGMSTDRNSVRFPSTTSRSFCRWTRRYGDSPPLDCRRVLLTSVSVSSQESWASDLSRVREFLTGYMRGGQQAEPMLQLDEVPPKHEKHTQQKSKHSLSSGCSS